MNTVLALVASGIFALYVYFLSRSVFLGWMSLLAVQLVNFTFGTNQNSFGGIHLDPLDFVGLALLFAGIVRTIPRLRASNTSRMIAFGLLGVFAFCFVRGVIANGFTTAANESRGFTGFLISILYFLTAPMEAGAVRKFIAAYLCYGGGLAIVASLAYAGLDVGAIAWAHHAEGAELGIDGRYLPADAAIAVAACSFISLGTTGEWRVLRGGERWLAPLFLGLAIFLRHRTIWLALAFGILTLGLLDKRQFKRLLPMLVLSVVVVAAVAFLSGEGLQSAESQFAESAQNSGTFEWRVNSWKALLFEEEQTPFTLMFGKSMGSGYTRLDPSSGQYVTVGPHSEYVTYIVRFGLVGFSFFLLYLFRTYRNLWTASRLRRGEIFPRAATWVALTGALLVYDFAYYVPADGYALIAIANVLLFKQTQAEPGDLLAGQPDLMMKGT